MAKQELGALAVSALCENLALLLGAGIQPDEAAGLLCEDSEDGLFKQTAQTLYKAFCWGTACPTRWKKPAWCLPTRCG